LRFFVIEIAPIVKAQQEPNKSSAWRQ